MTAMEPWSEFCESDLHYVTNRLHGTDFCTLLTCDIGRSRKKYWIGENPGFFNLQIKSIYSQENPHRKEGTIQTKIN